MGKILEVQSWSDFLPKHYAAALPHFTPAAVTITGSSPALGTGALCWEGARQGPGPPEPWDKRHKPGPGLFVLRLLVPGTSNLGLSFGKGAGPGVEMP